MGNRKSRTVLERIEARAFPQGDCIVWTGKLDRDGYGRLRPNVTGTDFREEWRA
jgi:hypothetical protein